MSAVRRPAVAGMFYPASARELNADVRAALDLANLGAEPAPAPKAIIAPHAGYVYSGPIAASAYVRLAASASGVRRVVLIGPSHRVPLRGLAVPSVEAFETPLGRVPLDRAAIADVLKLPQVCEWDAPHEHEHSLEVHLPFLQVIVPNLTLVPLVAGHASADEVAEVLERLWGGAETLIVVSSDLSHYLDDAAARRADAATCRAIEALDGDAIGEDGACGRVPIRGLLAVARRRQLAVETLDLRNSADTAGDRRRVVGYGAWAFSEPDKRSDEPDPGGRGEGAPGGSEAYGTRQMLDRHGTTLVHLAAASIEHGLRCGQALPVAAADFAQELRMPAACFVTLTREGRLRGCVGSLDAHRSLVEDVTANGFAAAFRDDRFPVLTAGERHGLHLSISVLTAPQPLHFADEASLIEQLRPCRDGLIIRSNGCRAVFLPQVWEHLAEPRRFLGELKAKAGLAADHWSSDFQAWRFITECVSSQSPASTTSLWS